MNEEESEELVDGDEGIINRRLPINEYNHQVHVGPPMIANQKESEECEGWENCKEEDEERKES